MDQRYFVSYKRWDGEATQILTATLGRFWDQDAAERIAQERYGVAGYEVIAVRPETAFEAARYKVYRVLVRSARIACAAVIGVVSYAWLHDSFVDTGDIPLGSLTGNMISTNLLNGGLAFAAAWLCWLLAFGDGPE